MRAFLEAVETLGAHELFKFTGERGSIVVLGGLCPSAVRHS